MSAYDVIVVGLGAIGSGAAWRLAAGGERVLGLDRFQPGHAFGSSHGASRIIREAYPDGDAYVPLVRRAIALRDEAGAETGRPVLHRVGALVFAPADERRIIGGRRSASRFGVPLEFLESPSARFPAFALPDGHVGLFEPGGGYVEPESGVAAEQELAARAGAELRHGVEVIGWEADGEGVRVVTGEGVERADRLVLAAGPWMPELLGTLGLGLRVERRLNMHFASALTDIPVFNLVVEEGQFYGFPAMGSVGLKLGRHDGDAPCTPQTIRRAVDDDEVASFRAVLERYLPGATGELLRTVTCMYTVSPDGAFIVDRHPEHPQVSFFTGCSGHAFKFAPALGELLATGERIEAFAAARFAVA
jgi:sarcosine oxidase